MSTYVLVPGMCHGGWCFDDLAADLRAAGHTVHALTLTGFGDPDRPADPSADLETHVADVVAAIDASPEPVVLAGHSYGGMPITVAADRRPGRVRALVYLDAFVPRDGESTRALTTDAQRAWYDEGRTDGLVPTMRFFDARATAHPLTSLEQPARISAEPAVATRVYVYAREWHDQESPFAATLARLRDDPAWAVHELDAAHNLMRDAPDALREILICATT